MSDTIHRWNQELADGSTLAVFVNETTRLLVVDIVNADESGGNEFVRSSIPQPPTADELGPYVAMGE